jgi:hypothetical protein
MTDSRSDFKRLNLENPKKKKVGTRKEFLILAKVNKCKGIERIKFLLFWIMDLNFIISSAEGIFLL